MLGEGMQGIDSHGWGRNARYRQPWLGKECKVSKTTLSRKGPSPSPSAACEELVMTRGQKQRHRMGANTYRTEPSTHTVYFTNMMTGSSPSNFKSCTM